jgi:hypothetical protein
MPSLRRRGLNHGYLNLSPCIRDWKKVALPLNVMLRRESKDNMSFIPRAWDCTSVLVVVGTNDVSFHVSVSDLSPGPVIIHVTATVILLGIVRSSQFEKKTVLEDLREHGIMYSSLMSEI